MKLTNGKDRAYLELANGRFVIFAYSDGKRCTIASFGRSGGLCVPFDWARNHNYDLVSLVH